MTKDKSGAPDIGNGLSNAVLPNHDDEDLGGAGGGAGGGTMAGAGEPSGGLMGTTVTMSGINDENIAAEAAALGTADGSLADAASGSAGGVSSAPTGAEAIGGGAGRGPAGSGTPGDHSELGGGGASLGQGGGTGPSGTASPGGDSRR